MIQKEPLIKEIIEIFTMEKINIRTLTEQGLLDEHNYWEDIVCHLLNLIFGNDFVNLNRSKKNYPGIDLGDSDIWDFDYLISAIKNLNFDEVKEIHDFLNRELNRQQTNEFKIHVSFILAYLNDSLEWLRLASENGYFYSDAYSCDRYNERCEKLAGILPQDEYTQLYSMLTEMDKTVEYIRQGSAYVNEKYGNVLYYSDIKTIRLNRYIKEKAASAYAKRNIIGVLEGYIK